MSNSYRMKKTGDLFFVIDEKTALIGEGQNPDDAYRNLNDKMMAYEALKEKSGFGDLSFQSYGGGTLSATVKKWSVVFVFLSLFSVSLSYAISTGLSYGMKGIDVPRGQALWSALGDSIIRLGRSDSLFDDPQKEQEVIAALKRLHTKINPYIEAFSDDEQ